jgi:hypothetical protein
MRNSLNQLVTAHFRFQLNDLGLMRTHTHRSKKLGKKNSNVGTDFLILSFFFFENPLVRCVRMRPLDLSRKN